MALVFADSFDHYATADISGKWTASVNASISAGNGRRSSQSMRFTGATGLANKTVAGVATHIMGASIKFSALTTAGYIFYLADAGSDQCGLFVNTDGTISFRRGTTNVATSATAMSTGTTYYLELKVVINNTTGTYEVRLNGSNILSATGQNTRSTANNSANGVWIYGRPGGAGAGGPNLGNCDFDDFYYCDSSGSTNNDFLGDVRIDAVYPSGNGNTSQMTGSDSDSTDNYLLVDEALQNGDTDYVQDSTSGHKDTYAMADITHTPSSIFAVQINMWAKKDDAGTRSICAVTRSGGSDTDGTTQALGTSYSCYREIRETDPNTSAAWTKANLNSAEFGHKVAA